MIFWCQEKTNSLTFLNHQRQPVEDLSLSSPIPYHDYFSAPPPCPFGSVWDIILAACVCMCVSFSIWAMCGDWLCAEVVKSEVVQDKKFNNNGFHFVVWALLGWTCIKGVCFNVHVSVCLCLCSQSLLFWCSRLCRSRLMSRQASDFDFTIWWTDQGRTAVNAFVLVHMNVLCISNVA